MLADRIASLLRWRSSGVSRLGGSYLTHAEYYELLSDLTGRELKAHRVPGPLLRLLGRIGDLRHRLFGTWVELDGEAAWVVTRCAPLDQSAVRRDFGIEPKPARKSFEDLLRWMFEAGLLDADRAPIVWPAGQSERSV